MHIVFLVINRTRRSRIRRPGRPQLSQMEKFKRDPYHRSSVGITISVILHASLPRKGYRTRLIGILNTLGSRFIRRSIQGFDQVEHPYLLSLSQDYLQEDSFQGVTRVAFTLYINIHIRFDSFTKGEPSLSPIPMNSILLKGDHRIRGGLCLTHDSTNRLVQSWCQAVSRVSAN